MLLSNIHFLLLLASQGPGALLGLGVQQDCLSLNLFVQELARSKSTGRVNCKREPGEESISCIEVIWAVVLLLYPCWSEDTVTAGISGEENHGNRNLVRTLIYCHQDICQVPTPWEKCIFHQYYTEISIRRINALNNCQGIQRNVPET